MNNPEEWRPVFNGEEMDYLIWEKEVGEMGTPHIQGYVRFKVRKTMAGAKRLLDVRVHLAAARGSEGENIAYCSKDRAIAEGDWGEHGVADPDIKQGRRSDLEDVIKDVRSGMHERYFFFCNMK